MMLSLTKNGLTGLQSTEIEKFRYEFAHNHCIYLPSLIEENLLNGIIKNVEEAFFFENQHLDKNNNTFASDLTILSDNIALHKINFLLNNAELFNVIEQITDCSEIKNFSARIYKNMPNQNHHLDWHDDTTDESRLIAVSVNLSRNKYEGGKFEIREKASKKMFREITCGNPGDTHLFRVSPQLQHRVTKTTGNFPRIAAAGWFTNQNQNSYFKK